MRKYDIAFSLGAACASSTCLRRANLQFASFPFDWITHVGPADRARMVANGFNDWMRKEDFVYLGVNELNGMGRFANSRLGFFHVHDFTNGPIDDSYDAVEAKYVRRTGRLVSLLSRARSVLVLYVDSSKQKPHLKASADELLEARSVLAAAFPRARFDMLHFVHDDDVPYEVRRIDASREGLTEVTFNYRSEVTDVNFGEVVEVLRHDLGLRVRDYRTREEKRAYVRRRRLKRYGVDSGFALLAARVRMAFARIAAPFTRT